MRAHESQAIWPDNSHAAAAGVRQDLALKRCAVLADFAKTGGNDNCRWYSGLYTLSNHAGNGVGWSGDHRQIHCLRNALDAVITGQPQQRVAFWIHWVDSARERSVLKIRKYGATHAVRRFSGADHGHIFRMEAKLQRAATRGFPDLVVMHFGAVRAVIVNDAPPTTTLTQDLPQRP